MVLMIPSLNLSYNLEKTKYRFSLSKTLARPEFREVANFAYYDFVRNAQILGNSNLKKTDIYNVDLKYELYPSNTENIWFFRKELYAFRSWDYSYNLDLFRRSLEKTVDTIEHYGHEVEESRMKKVEKMKRTIQLIKNVRSDEYVRNAEKESYDEEVDLDALLKELEMEEGKEESDEDDDMEDEMKEAKKEDEDEDDQDAMSKMKKKHAEELAEIRSQAAELAGKVNETNLINAKLLYLNKILHKHNLSEAQKVKVIAAFDKATNVKEAKIVFESLNEAFGVKNDKSKTNLKESLGFASKAAGTSTKREIITEADVQVARWQKLAGINKTNQ